MLLAYVSVVGLLVVGAAAILAVLVLVTLVVLLVCGHRESRDDRRG